MLNELRFALRSLRRNPSVTAVAVLTLALGIGPTTAVYSVVEGVLLRPLPYRDPGRLVRVGWTFKKYYSSHRMAASPSLAEVRAWMAQSHSFEAMSPYSGDDPVLTGLGPATRINAFTVKSNLFAMLGVEPVMGRGFTTDEDRQGSPPAAVLSYRFWKKRLGGDPHILGRSLNLNGKPLQIVGVMPPAFHFPVMPAGFPSAGTDVWRSLGSTSEAFDSQGREAAELVARLRPGVTIEEAKADLDVIERRWSESLGQVPDRVTIVTPLRDFAVGAVRPALLLALSAVGLVLLIACANAANLLLARAAARGRETAIRTALGAGRLRIMRQALIEAVLLALTGAAVGILLAAWGVPLLAALAGTSLPRLENVGINLQVLVATGGAAVATGVLFGAVPALQSVRRGSAGLALKEGGAAAGTGKSHARASGAFVVGQIALTLMLLIAAGLLGRSFIALSTLRPGFDPDHALVAQVQLPQAQYSTDAQTLAFSQLVIDRARALPGVTAAAVTTGTPLAVGAVSSVRIPGQAEHPEAQWASITAVTPDFFRALDIPLRRGRLFVEGDGGGARPVIVSEALVRDFFPGQDPLGKRVAAYGGVGTIVGVVGDTREMSLADAPPPVIYGPLADGLSSYLKVVVRTEGDPAAVAPLLRATLRQIDPEIPVDELQPMRDMMAESIATQRFYATLVGVFATLALLMAAAGLYALISYAVARRTRELGLRIALGAEAPQVLALVIRRGALLTLVGIVIGGAGAFATTRVLKSLLFEIAPTDPVTFIGVALGLGLVALLASYVPARRATRVDPMQALRHE